MQFLGFLTCVFRILEISRFRWNFCYVLNLNSLKSNGKSIFEILLIRTRWFFFSLMNFDSWTSARTKDNQINFQHLLLSEKKDFWDSQKTFAVVIRNHEKFRVMGITVQWGVLTNTAYTIASETAFFGWEVAVTCPSANN